MPNKTKKTTSKTNTSKIVSLGFTPKTSKESFSKLLADLTSFIPLDHKKREIN